MTPDEIRQFIYGGEWVSITTEVRPSSNKSPSGDILPLFCDRVFVYSPDDKFALTFMNYADPNGKVPLAKIEISGHLAWQGPHPLAEGAYKVDYVADDKYTVTPLHAGFAAVANKFPAAGLTAWEVGVSQDLLGKAFPLFSLVEGETYVDYDLIYVHDNLFFNGSKNVDGRAFDKPENRPTNLQVPLVHK